VGNISGSCIFQKVRDAYPVAAAPMAKLENAKAFMSRINTILAKMMSMV
jgi:hypothetical protein